MATILLSAAGAAAGAFLGPLGVMAGKAVGAMAGAAIDHALIRSTLPETTRGPRLSDLSVQTSTEGRDIPRVYGRVRLSGQIFWATRYEEDTITAASGGKGGPSVKSYRYFANFAVGLCAGEISRVARVWADGVELDLATVQMRVHPGSATQLPDALIQARQGDPVPAYRDLAYVVFERLPLDDYGNRIPQLSFEVIRVVDTLEGRVRAVTLIPGSTEFGYSPTALTTVDATGATVSENRHTGAAASDVAAALDELQDLCPALTRVSLVVAWFGDDLRAGTCTLTPRVMSATRSVSTGWSVSGVDRASARTVSGVAGDGTAATIAAYGGTPDDASVIAAIREIRRRGLKVTLYPFILMDIPAGNTLPDPYGGARQAAYPWRGRITCMPAPGRPGTPDKTAAAATQIAAFVGQARIEDFAVSGDAVVYTGAPEWSLRRMVLHYARLAVAAGGVDAILLGSELRGLTTVRTSATVSPFVAALVTLAADVRAIVGNGTRLSYAADWTEWFGYQPADGSGDAVFLLDPFWADANVDFIGIDSYAPLSDWRYGDTVDAALADTPHDLAYLRGNLLGGEYYDWYYATAAARQDQVRTAIADGVYNEPWIYRPKDLASWWSNVHRHRVGGVRMTATTAWVPASKPIWLTETGCPAVDLGANQPNMFPDAQSSEGGLPYFSRGARDDLMQRRYCEAVLSGWDPADPAHVPAANLTTAAGVPMVDPATIHLWTWDARPFPAFPACSGVWADAANWRTGHWLSGRLGGCSVDALIRGILSDFGFVEVETEAIGGHVEGYIIDTAMSARSALEPLLSAWQVDAMDTGVRLRFAGRSRAVVAEIGRDELIDAPQVPMIELRRTQDTDLPHEISVTVSDSLRDHHRTTVNSRRLVGASARSTRADLAMVVPLDVATGMADQWLHDLWIGRERLAFALPPARIDLEPGDIVRLDVGDDRRTVLIERIADGLTRQIEGRIVDPAVYGPTPVATRGRDAIPGAAFGPPIVHVLDIAHLGDAQPAWQPYLAIHAAPWPGSVSVLRQVSGGGSYRLVATHDRRATMGTTVSAVPPGVVSRWDRTSAITVSLLAGELSSVGEAQVLGGANLAAIRTTGGGWEVLQFATATLIAPNTYRLSQLLRLQGGSDDAWTSAMPAGSVFVLLDEALLALPISRDDIGLPLSFRVGPSRDDYTAASYRSLSVTATARNLLPWSPTHIVGTRDPATGDLAVRWVRRSRLAGADVWSAGDVPLGEEAEAYRVQVLNGGAVVRQADVATAGWIYTAGMQAADFGVVPASCILRVAQLSTALGPGIWSAATTLT